MFCRFSLMVIFGLMVFDKFSHIVIFSALKCLIYSAQRIRPSDPARSHHLILLANLFASNLSIFSLLASISMSFFFSLLLPLISLPTFPSLFHTHTHTHTHSLSLLLLRLSLFFFSLSLALA